ncbi:MAG: response regulator [Gammaproteobacteria bacterium]|nr:response regulator [Gammaproteobacteria bacterium]
MSIRNRLGVSLTLWILAVALLPLLGVTLFSLQNARDNLHAAAVQTVIIQAQQEANAMQTYGQQIVTTLLRESRLDRNLEFMSALNRDYLASGLPIQSYATSYRRAQLVDQYAANLQELRLFEGYYDLLLVDPAGNVLHTLAGETDLGSNLFSGVTAGTNLAAAVRKSFYSGRPVFSDLEHYLPSGNRISGFMAAPMVDVSGEKIGTFVLQITERNITQALSSTMHNRRISGMTYLIANDLTLRSPGPAAVEDYLDKRIDTALTRNWLKHLAATENRPRHHHKDEILTLLDNGPLGNQVIGAIYTLKLPEVTWAIIAEVDADTAFAAANRYQWQAVALLVLTILLVTLITIPVTRNIVRPLLALTHGVKRVRDGDLDTSIISESRNELGQLAEGFNAMVSELRQAQQLDSDHNWLQKAVNRLNDAMRGDHALPELSRIIIDNLCETVNAAGGAFYVVRNNRIKLFAAHARSTSPETPSEFALGEGFIGQAALDRKPRVISDLPQGYFALSSGLGSIAPSHLIIVPLTWNGEVVALLEFASLHPPSPLDNELLTKVNSRIAITVQSTIGRERTEDLLTQTQLQAEELQAREEELRDSNRLLAHQADELRRSEEGLQRSQTELEEKNEQLQVQQEELRIANQELLQRADELQQATREIEQRAAEVGQASRYKSEFLANMSHELRTPLNSLLILSRLLSENKSGNLNEQQVKFAQTIHDSGSDLLHLINDILDLAKIESGRMDVHAELIHLNDFISDIERKFLPLAEAKQITLAFDTTAAPQQWRSDSQKLTQIVRNLLSNAIKFTAKGGNVGLRIGAPEATLCRNSSLPVTTENQEVIAFSVSDSGIGIPLDKRQTIFEAFHQADGTTSRQYGGTGLGLTISRELAQLLGGEILLESEEGKGSQFHLLLPHDVVAADVRVAALASTSRPTPTPAAAPPPLPTPLTAVTAAELPDDRHTLKPEERSILIIEDDTRFADILASTARDHNFKVLLATDGESGLYLADYHQPSGIILDIGLPGINGFKVMERLKESGRTRHIPVHIMSAADRETDALSHGAIGFLTKPVDLNAMNDAFTRIEQIIERPVKRLLLVEDDPTQQESVRALLGGNDLEIISATSGTQALELLSAQSFDCLVLDLGLDDMNGIELLESLSPKLKEGRLPVVIYTGRDLEPKERHLLRKYARSVIIKDAQSPERLLDDTALFLHRIESNLPGKQQRMLQMLHDSETLFKGRKVLLVDDDMRNVFALSAALQEREMQVITATNGIEALDMLAQHTDVALVLMDIMMPQMDGYEAMRRIRAQPSFARLPIIALTAKAMKGDRGKCIEAGASDYLAKPIDSAKLISMMRVWLYR